MAVAYPQVTPAEHLARAIRLGWPGAFAAQPKTVAASVSALSWYYRAPTPQAARELLADPTGRLEVERLLNRAVILLYDPVLQILTVIPAEVPF